MRRLTPRRTKFDKERKFESSVEKVKQDYNEAVVHTIDDVVKAHETVHSNLTRNLIEKVTTTFDYHDDDKWKSHREEGHFTDYTKNVKGYTEEGDKEKKNWWSYLKDGLDFVQNITEIPFLKSLPGGKYLRKLKGWGWAIDLAKKGAGIFAEEGKVKYKDTKEDTTVNEKGGTDRRHHGQSRS